MDTLFQSLVRDSAHSDSSNILMPPPNPAFQSLVRDSAHSDSIAQRRCQRKVAFQSLVRDSAHSDYQLISGGINDFLVSIPRSGFCSFRHGLNRLNQARGSGFNPSFGILLIQTARRSIEPYATSMFQSLVRDSAHSDARKCARPGSHQASFNPSFGILLIQTAFFGRSLAVSGWFQSLVRDSAHSDPKIRQDTLYPHAVSIPRSGFCSFRHRTTRHFTLDFSVSIPRSGFCSFRPASQPEHQAYN